MGLGTIPAPTTRRVWVGTADPAATLIGGLQTANMTGSSTTTTEKFEDGYPSYTAVGPNAWEVQLGGKYLKGDDGQNIVNSAFITKADVFVSLAPNGVDGRQLPGKVSRLVMDIANADTLTGWQATISGNGDPTDVAGGV